MAIFKPTQRFHVRPGVIWWKEGETGYFFLDQVTSEGGELNQTAFSLLGMLAGRKTMAELARQMYHQYPGVAFSQVEADVHAALGQLVDDRLVIAGDLHKVYDEYWAPVEEETKAFYGTSRQPGLVYWEVTNACNYRCLFCYNYSGRPRPGELTLEEGLLVLDQLRDSGVTGIIFTGGEPLVARDKVLAWVAWASDIGIMAQLFTNGSLLTTETAERLARAGLRYARVSIHGARPETVDRITGVKSSFEKSLAGMRNLIAADVPVCWQMTTNKYSLPELRQALEMAIEMGCHGFRTGSLDIMGRGEDQASITLAPEDELRLWKFIDEAIVAYGDRIHIGWGADACMELAWDYWVLHPRKPDPSDATDPEVYMRYCKNSLCGLGIRSWALTAHGDITPCPALADLVMGNIRTDDFLEVWENGEFFRIMRENIIDDFEKCGTCGFRYTCVAGCRAIAYHCAGSLTGPDVRRCAAIEAIHAKGMAEMPSFFEPEELDVEKYPLTEREGPPPYRAARTEGVGPWIPYHSIVTRKMLAPYVAQLGAKVSTPPEAKPD